MNRSITITCLQDKRKTVEENVKQFVLDNILIYKKGNIQLCISCVDKLNRNVTAMSTMFLIENIDIDKFVYSLKEYYVFRNVKISLNIIV